MKSVLYLGCPLAERADAERQLGIADVSVVWADNISYALTELERREMPVLLDLSRGASALQIARELRTQRASTLMFAVVDNHRPDLTTEAVLTGMADVFARPLGGRRVANAIDRERQFEMQELDPGFDAHHHDLYTHSPAMLEVMTVVTRASAMRAGVLIRGEEGTGRQIAARAVHAQNGAAGAFVAIDCAAHDGDDLDDALFGRAARSRHGEGPDLERVGERGALYRARGGTIYFQNVAEAPARVQARVARVLRDREAVFAETGQPIDFDVRPMAGVDPEFDVAVSEGRVRDDLLRRLAVIRIDMPPLRRRREDIPALANYFLRDICASRRLPPKVVSRPALLLISALPWRGNAAEMRTLLETVVGAVPDSRGIGLEDVLAHVRLDGGSTSFPDGGTLKQARSRFEREYIGSVLEQHKGRISEAAVALGIQRTNLYRKMRALRVTAGRRR
ncbi:MAG: hypothetical protein DMF93_06065 [Acidobacteria bacterium]|nr:MAG: hypothetical protein DMF93_06065 [Acidobacteriota bacterium]